MCSYYFFQASDEDIGKNAKVAFTIKEGNDKELFWINSTSGELFLVAPITFTADDSVVLVVEAQNTFATNILQDTTFVNVSFYGRRSNFMQLDFRRLSSELSKSPHTKLNLFYGHWLSVH